MSAACYSNLIAYFFDGRAPFQDSCLIRQHNKEVWWHSEDQSGVVMSKVGELGRSSGKNSQQDPLSRVFLCDCPLPSCSAVSHSTAHSSSQTLAAARALSISCSKYLGRNCRQYFNAVLNAVRLRLVTPRSLVYSRTTLHYSLLSVFPGGVSSSNGIGGISQQQQQQHSRQQLQIPHITAHGIGP